MKRVKWREPGEKLCCVVLEQQQQLPCHAPASLAHITTHTNLTHQTLYHNSHDITTSTQYHS